MLLCYCDPVGCYCATVTLRDATVLLWDATVTLRDATVTLWEGLMQRRTNALEGQRRDAIGLSFWRIPNSAPPCVSFGPGATTS